MSTQISPIAEHESSERSPSRLLAFPARYARFGTFQADFEREELYQNGQRVRVQAKLFQGLLLLLSRAGEVVTRNEVRRHLWPDAFLSNLDANVNTTMNKLRLVLGDSPESPVYIETIPRRGYSFIAAVEFSDVAAESSAEVAKAASGRVSEAEGPSAFWSNERLHRVARVAALLFAGMIFGALLASVWFVIQAKNPHRANNANTGALLSECAYRVVSR
ncbi:MAG: lysine decarboxylase transcriptional regulator, CadC [Candidatus Acidoferrum typicum]|nr:lysine decarboxylase transcriptional regulator, CadC [Candidatus Acidoferrum typicum]